MGRESYTVRVQVEVVHLPAELTEVHLRDRCVVVFDVLRATTSMIAALASGAREIRVFDSLDAARSARDGKGIAPIVLCGEKDCVRPDGFDLGNSPGDFTADRVRGKTVLLSTTNGTRAIVASQTASELFIAALVNAGAMAERLVTRGRDVTLLCSGTNGVLAPEDVIGAGAVIDHLRLRDSIKLTTAPALGAWNYFLRVKDDLPATLGDTDGGRNIMNAHLDADIDFAASLDRFDIVGQVLTGPLRVVMT